MIILNSGLSLASLKREAITGIDVQNTIGTSIGMLITKNAILNSRIGIHTRNYPNIKIGKDATSFNTITDQKPVPNLIFDFPERYGIWVENCNFATINNNQVEWTGGTINDPGYLRTHTGIGISRSLSCTAIKNSIKNYGGGLKVFEDCSLSELRCNIMEHCFHGVYFDVNGMNNLIAPHQGIYTSIQANDVSWNNQWINNIANKVDGTVPLNFQIRWVYDVNSTIEFDPDPSATFISRQPGNSHITCP